MKLPRTHKNSKTFQHHWPALAGACLIGLLCMNTAQADSRDQAKRMHDRLAGVPPTEEVLCAMADLIASGDPEGAAQIVMNTGSVPDPSAGNTCSGGSGTIDNSLSKNAFYSVSLKNFVTPWTNEEQTIYAPLNDYTATVIGIIRDDHDFREVLTGNYVYKDPGASYSLNNNTAYENLENSHADLSLNSNLASTDQPWADPGGVNTTRAAGLAFFKDGTNRAMFRYTMINFMCRDLEQLKDTSRVPDRIRQDVSRSPGGDSSLFLNSCIGCHSGMDPLAGAYAYYDWAANEQPDGTDLGNITHSTTIVHNPDADPPVKHKYLINSNNFPYGYITTDDSWKNYWRAGPNSNLGWQGNTDGSVTSGTGVNSMQAELANTEAFAECQVEKVYTQVCLQPPVEGHADNTNTTPPFTGPAGADGIKQIKEKFESGGYNLKDVFAKSATLCMGN